MNLRAALLVTSLLGVNSFNLDLQHPLIYESNIAGSYFGYSVGLNAPTSDSKSNQSWLLVGAPKDSDTLPNGIGLKKVGAVYKYFIKDKSCTKLTFSFQELIPDQSDYSYELSSALLGSAIDVVSGRYLISSPNWMVKFTRAQKNKDFHRMYGVCYFGDFEKSTQEFLMPLAPSKGETERDLFEISKGKYLSNYMWGQAGFSSHLSANANGAYEILLGAPSVRYGKGTTVYYRNGSLQEGGFDKNTNLGVASGKPQPLVLDVSSLKDVGYHGLLGYAVTRGRYFLKSGEFYTVSGAPAAMDTGLVYAFAAKKESERFGQFEVKVSIAGAEVGEYFGAALATGDINGDGLDDLVVGAPLYTNDAQKSASQNEGRVFVYFGGYSQKFDNPKTNHIIKGDAYNGRFGTTIACIGDLDQDGMQDFAIAAPFEGSGVVYIYRGSADGLVWSQKIVGSDLHHRLAGFGFSISRGQDIDRNGYNDIAIGAFKSGHAVIIRSKPVIKLNASIHILDAELKNDQKSNFSAEICVEYHGKHAPSKLSVAMVVTLDPGYQRIYSNILKNVTNAEILQVTLGNAWCHEYMFFVKPSIKFDYLVPIQLKAEFFLPPTNDSSVVYPVITNGNVTTGKDKFCATCAMLHKQPTDVQIKTIGFASECKNQSHCIANLFINMKFVDENDTEITSLVVGSLETLYLRVVVSNEGDPAHNTQLIITLPNSPISMPVGCMEITNDSQVQVECDAANPLRRAGSHVFTFGIDAEKTAAAEAKNLNVSAEIRSVTINENFRSSSVLSLPLSFEADVEVFGKAEESSYYFNVAKEIEQMKNVNKKINASVNFQVEKYGLSPLQEVVLTVEIPVAFSGTDNYFLMLAEPKFRMNKRLNCDPNPMAGLISSLDKPGSANFHHQNDGTRSRNKRNADESLNFPAEKTLVIECSSSEWQCARLTCRTDLLQSQSPANLDLLLQINTAALESVLGVKDTIVIKLTAKVEISKPHGVQQPAAQKPDVVLVPIVLRRGASDGELQAWIIAVSLICGVALFAAMLFALHKVGFFKRPHREQMQLLEKKEAPQGEIAMEYPVNGHDAHK